MKSRQEKGNRTAIEWPYFQAVGKGIENMEKSVDVYRSAAKEMAEVTKKCLMGNYDEITDVWQKVMKGNGNDIIDSFFNPYREAGSSLLKGAFSGADIFRFWQQGLGTAPSSVGAPYESADEFLSLYRQMQECLLGLLSNWNRCVYEMAKASQNASVNPVAPPQMLEAWIAILERFSDDCAEAGVSFAKEQRRICFKFAGLPLRGEKNAKTAKNEGEGATA